MSKILDFPKLYGTPEETLEHAKGWDFETVVIIGHTAEGGSDEGGLILTGSKRSEQTSAKDMLFIAELLRFMAMKQLRFL